MIERNDPIPWGYRSVEVDLSWASHSSFFVCALRERRIYSFNQALENYIGGVLPSSSKVRVEPILYRLKTLGGEPKMEMFPDFHDHVGIPG